MLNRGLKYMSWFSFAIEKILGTEYLNSVYGFVTTIQS